MILTFMLHGWLLLGCACGTMAILCYAFDKSYLVSFWLNLMKWFTILFAINLVVSVMLQWFNIPLF